MTSHSSYGHQSFSSFCLESKIYARQYVWTADMQQSTAYKILQNSFWDLDLINTNCSNIQQSKPKKINCIFCCHFPSKLELFTTKIVFSDKANLLPSGILNDNIRLWRSNHLHLVTKGVRQCLCALHTPPRKKSVPAFVSCHIRCDWWSVSRGRETPHANFGTWT
jgi:hypothetical protein